MEKFLIPAGGHRHQHAVDDHLGREAARLIDRARAEVAALTQFTRSLGVEIGRTGVRVNAIAPDLIESVQVPYRTIVPADDWDKWPGWAPLGGPGQPVDIAGPALFLASDLARYITGTVIHVDGGSHAAGGWFPTEEGGWTNRPRKA